MRQIRGETGTTKRTTFASGLFIFPMKYMKQMVGISAPMIRYCDKGKTNTGLKKNLSGCPKSCACTTGSCQVIYQEDSFN